MRPIFCRGLAMFFHGGHLNFLPKRRQQVFVGSVEVRHVGMWPLLPGPRTPF